MQKLFSLEEYLGLCSLCSPVLSRWAWERSFPPNRLTPTMSTSGVTHTIQSTFVRRSQAFTIGRNFLLVCCCILPCCKLFFSFWMHFRDGWRRNQHTPNSHTRTHVSWCATTHTKSFLSPSSQSSWSSIVLHRGCLLSWKGKKLKTHTQSPPSFHIIVAEQTNPIPLLQQQQTKRQQPIKSIGQSVNNNNNNNNNIIPEQRVHTSYIQKRFKITHGKRANISQ